MSTSSVKVAYLVEEFPKLSESFVIEEVYALSARNAIAGVLSISKPNIPSGRYPELISHTRYPKTSQIFKANLILIFSLWYWRWLFRTIMHYPRKVLAFFRTVSFLPVLGEMKPQHLHTHFATFASFMTMAVSERTGIPYSLTVHATGIFQEKKLISEKCRNAKFVVAISNFNKRYLAENFRVPENKIKVVHCGIRPAHFDPISEGRKKKNDTRRKRILSLGRLVEKKGFHILLEALELLRSDKEWTMAIAGDGPTRALLENSIAEKVLEERVTLSGRISSDELMEEFIDADIFILPCVKASNGDMDGIPVVLIEALYCGIPTISTKLSGIPELIVHRETGLLVEQGSPEELAEAISYLMTHAEEAASFAEKGRNVVEMEFNILNTSTELYNLFLQALLQADS